MWLFFFEKPHSTKSEQQVILLKQPLPAQHTCCEIALGCFLTAHHENGQNNDKQNSCHDANQDNCVHEESFLSRW